MTLFSFVWVFVFCLFWRAAAGGAFTGGVWAVFFGLVIALFQRFAGSPVYAGGFGFLRWVSSFVDIIVFPVLLPLGLCFVFLIFNVFSDSLDMTNFILVWLIPCSILRAMGLESYPPPMEAVFVPLLWTALAVGMPFFIRMSGELYGFRSALALAACAALPLLGATAYWAFFCQRLFLAYSLAALTVLPMFCTMTIHVVKAERHG
ncbi:MAG: hypothetical protein LBI85_06695 [Spirochaetaceae bacterium]|jgi:hypothetical protein|nr:hypothetical protein [Spirochaetaceae bacterium]